MSNNNGKVFREAIKILDSRGIHKNTITAEMGIDNLQFNRYYVGSRIPSAEIVNGIIIRYGLDIELVEEEIEVTKEPIKKEEPIILPKQEEPIPQTEPIILPKQEEPVPQTEPIILPKQEEPVPEKEPEFTFDMNDFLRKFNSLSDYNKKTIVDMVDSLTIVQSFDKEKEESKVVKHEHLGIRLKK